MSQTFESTEKSTLQQTDYVQKELSTSALRDSYVVTIESGLDDWLIAKCPTLNVVTQGKTQDEVTKNVVDAISLMLEELGKPKEFTILTRRK
jgi:predicted RNase H-like HicB family nuclease